MSRLARIAQLYPSLLARLGRLRSLVHEGLDLTYNQYKTLLTIADRQACSLGDLAGELEVAHSSASQMVERLVGLGLVQREPDRRSRRQVTISLTAAGKSLLAEWQQGVLTRYERLLQHLSEQDQDALVGAFETIYRILDQLGEEPKESTCDR